MAAVSAKGGFNLFLGLTISTVITAAGVILIARLLSPTEYGLFAIVWIPAGIITLFRDWGVNSSMIRYIAQYKAENRTAKVKSVLISGLLFELVLGITLSSASLFLSNILATNIFNRPDLEPLIEVASLTIFAGALTTAAQSAFIGFERMESHAITMILQSALRSLLAPILVLMGLGVLGATIGITVASLLTGIISILVLYTRHYKNLEKPKDDTIGIMGNMKTMLKFGLPLSASVILNGFLIQFCNLLIAVRCADEIIGNYQVAANFAVLIGFFVTPIQTVLFPAFSKINPEKEVETLRNVFQFSVKYAALLVVPVAACVMAVSQPAIYTLFGEEYRFAPIYLTLYSINYLYSAFGTLSLENALNGQGETKTTMKLALITTALGLPLSLLLIPEFGVTGLIATSLIAGVPSLLVGLWWMKRLFAATINWITSGKILFAAALATLTTRATVSQLDLPNWTELIAGTMIFSASYMILASFTKVWNQTDIQGLRGILKELEPFSHLFTPILNMTERLMLIFSRT